MILERRPDCAISDSVAPDHPSVGALLPYSPLHLALMAAVDQPVIMTSANISGEPILYDFETARYRMYGVAEAALVHDRRIQIFADDSVVKITDGKPRVWRRSRGYVPESVNLSVPFQHTTLGFGAELKNTFAIGKSSSAILSQHLGDFETTEGVEAAQQALEHYLKLFDARIERVACDLHPDYISTRIAEEWSDARDLPLVRVQHHHAHLAACLAERHHAGPAVGLILDGTGYGADGYIWGGELLFGDCKTFTRFGHLQDVPLLGHDAAARQPWRMALAWLNQVYDSNLDTLDLRLLRQIDEQYGRSAKTLLLQAARQTPFIRTTSLGRLFDAVAALIGFGAREQYEGQAAMWLEGIISRNTESGYDFEINEANGAVVLSPEPMFRRLVTDLLSGAPARLMSRRFHEGLAQAWTRMALIAAEEESCEHVALSGGCFQNKFLLERISSLLMAQNINVLVPENVPVNDGGIALGQVVIANSLEL
ncbi:MAG: carbamoyltransferase HypF [bacterium]|nr:carbamoyltransferase HypF [bacterium]